MSYVDPSQDPNNPNNQPVGSAPPATSSGGGAGVVSGGDVGGAAAPQSASATKPSSSGSWTNLDSYLNANSGQGDQVGNQLTAGVDQQGAKAQKETSDLSNQFNQGVSAGTTQENSGAVSQAVQDASQLQAGQDLSQSDINNFAQQANASYSGPTDVTKQSGYGQTLGDINQAQTSANEGGSESGRDVLLHNQFDNASASGYNQGENNLDQMLLENSSGGRQLSGLANQWSGLNGALNSDVTSGNAAAQAAAQQTAQTSADAISAFNTGRTAADTSVQNYLQNAQANYSGDYNNLVGTLNGYNGGNLSVSAQQAQLLGLNNNQQIYNLSQAAPGQLGSQYLSQSAFNNAQEITANQQAELAALDKLGLSGNQTATNQYTNAALAGTQNADNSINSSNFQQAVNQADGHYNTLSNQVLTGTGQGSYADAGQLVASTADNQAYGTLAEYIAAGEPQAGTAGLSTNTSNLYQLLQNELAGSGYGNTVNVQGAPGITKGVHSL